MIASSFPNFEEVRELIQLARREDLGSGDVTSATMIAEGVFGTATIVQRGAGVACGLPVVEMVCAAYDMGLRVRELPGLTLKKAEARFTESRHTPLLQVHGPLRSLLSAERVILNFLQHLSGVATMTHRFVRRIEGTRAKIYDTRKTLPGFRALDKYAVRCGGGLNHRMGLFDALLVKDNHLAAIPVKELAPFLSNIISRSRDQSRDRWIEVEVDNLQQFREVLNVDGIDVVLLDNMDCPTMAKAVEMRDAAGRSGSLSLEASGGVTYETVYEIAASGVDRIAIGAITHSTPALDIGLDIEPDA